MANTYTQLYFHIVFVVKGRANLISSNWEIDLHKYITGIISNKQQKLMIINGMPDHLHLLVSTSPNINLSQLTKDIKSNSSRWINEQEKVKGKFRWQRGFGAFSVSHSQVNKVIQYILNQKKHHKKKSFSEEYLSFLKAHNVDYEEKYLFKKV